MRRYTEKQSERKSRNGLEHPIEFKRRWHAVELAARKRGIIMGAFVGILVLFAFSGYFGVATTASATETGTPPEGIWSLLWRFMSTPLMIGGLAGAAYIVWFMGHHERSLQNDVATLSERDSSMQQQWRALRVSDRIYLSAYLVVTGLGIAARFA